MFQKSLSFCGLQPNSCGGACALALIHHQSLSPRLQLLSSYAFLLPDAQLSERKLSASFKHGSERKKTELLHPQKALNPSAKTQESGPTTIPKVQYFGFGVQGDIPHNTTILAMGIPEKHQCLKALNLSCRYISFYINPYSPMAPSYE